MISNKKITEAFDPRLSKFQCLRVLKLAYCNIGVKGARAVGNYICHPASGQIVSLVMDGNPIKDEGCMFISKSLVFRLKSRTRLASQELERQKKEKEAALEARRNKKKKKDKKDQRVRRNKKKEKDKKDQRVRKRRVCSKL
jgi:hypothetical protein